MATLPTPAPARSPVTAIVTAIVAVATPEPPAHDPTWLRPGV